MADVVRHYRSGGHTDPGEARALEAVGERRHGTVLDLGVGGGRSTGLLASGAASYVGIDVAPPMLELARRQHPEVDLRLGDARDLRDFPDGSFDLVLFSFNGIDALDHAGRRTAVEEMARVLAPDGRVVLSSLNRDGVSFDERPWTIRSRRPVGVARELALLVRHPVSFLRSLRWYRQTRHDAVDGPDWAMRPMRAHEFRFVVHFAAVPDTVRLLDDGGLVVESAWSERGAAVSLTRTDPDADWVHYVCSARLTPPA